MECIFAIGDLEHLDLNLPNFQSRGRKNRKGVTRDKGWR